jgi:hypothetical protein
MRMTLAIFACLVVGAYAGMIDLPEDNDPLQEFDFSACDPDSYYAVIVGASINLDSGYSEIEHVLTDTVRSVTFGYIRPDKNSNGRLIPGHYAGQYWFYVIGLPRDGSPVLPVDTLHQTVSYDILPGCGAVFRRD